MRTCSTLVLLLMLPAVALAGNSSTVSQAGKNNKQATRQTGQNISVTVQHGNDNYANTQQTGRHNISAIAQMGDGHQRSVVQNGNDQGYGSLQFNSRFYKSSTTLVGGNDASSVTLSFEGN